MTGFPGDGSMPMATRAKGLILPACTLSVSMPKPPTTLKAVRRTFFQQSLEWGRQSSPAIMLAVTEIYLKRISNHSYKAIMKKFGNASLASTQVSRATKLLDNELSAWHNRS